LRPLCNWRSQLSWPLTGAEGGMEHVAFAVLEKNIFPNYLLLVTRLRLGREVKNAWMS